MKKTTFVCIDKTLPYSPVVVVGDNYYFSGVVPRLDDDKKLVSPGNIKLQTQEILERIQYLLEGCDLTLNDVYGVTLMLEGDMDQFATVNKLYSEFFADVKIKPRRKAFAVAELPFKAMIEIEFEAIKQK